MAKIGSIAMNGMSIAELQSYLDSGALASGLIPAVRAKIAGLKSQQAKAPSAAPAAAAPAAAPAAAAPDRSALDAAAKDWVNAQNANIDAQKNQSLSTGLSNMIASGLAGTTAVGGMTAGVGEAATRAKNDVAAQAKMQTENMALQYAGLAQSASEGAANRALTASEGAANRANSVTLAGINQASSMMPQPTPSVPGLDAFGRPMSGSLQQMTAGGGSSLAKQYPNLSAAAPNVFDF